MQSIETVLFDFDGTLSDSLIAIHGIINAMRSERHEIPLPADTMRPHMSLVGEALVRGCLGSAARDSATDLAEFRRRYLQVEPDARHLYVGAPETIAALQRTGLRLAICSNKPQDILKRFVEGTGLHSYFEAVVGAGPTMQGKPHPDMIWHTLNLLNASATSAVLVGDNESDAEAAGAAGLAFILVTHGYANGSPEQIPHHARVDRLDQLPALLQSKVLSWDRSPKRRAQP